MFSSSFSSSSSSSEYQFLYLHLGLNHTLLIFMEGSKVLVIPGNYLRVGITMTVILCPAIMLKPRLRRLYHRCEPENTKDKHRYKTLHCNWMQHFSTGSNTHSDLLCGRRPFSTFTCPREVTTSHPAASPFSKGLLL